MARFIEETLDIPVEQAPAKKSPKGRKSSAKPSFSRGGSAQQERSTERTNTYPGKCTKCGERVPAGQGLLKGFRGNWYVEHRDCYDVQQIVEQHFAVPEGTFTVIWEDGYKTIRVRKQDEFSDFMPGRIILSYLSGPDNTRSYTSFAHVQNNEVRFWKKHQGNQRLREAVKLLLGDPKAAAVAFARESGCCAVCGRELTTPESIERGIGPKCVGKFA